jgi:type I restriction enzyme S subunit
MSKWKYIAIGDLVEKAKTWNPIKSSPDNVFSYIDLSSIDQELKIVIEAKEIKCSEAPSRARQLVAEGDVLVSTVRPNLNGVATVNKNFDGVTVSTGFCVLKPLKEHLSSNYLFHWVKSSIFINDMVMKATGANYPAVSDRIIFESKIPLPPIAEQKRIAEILDRTQSLISKRKEAISKLDTLTQSIFIEMFGDPVKNPKGWERIVLGDVITSASDGPHVSPKYVDEGIPFLSTRHIRHGGIDWNDLKFLSVDDAQIQWKKCRPQRGDILYTKGGTTGIAATVDFDEPFAIWVHVALLKTNKNKVQPKWLENMLNSSFCYQQSQRLTHGIANRDLGLKRMVGIEMFLPPLPLQKEFAQRVEAVEKLKATHRASLSQLEALFASLQHRAFRGEL